jgi:excisionase family DNA binding protein
MQVDIVRSWLTYREAEQLVGLSRTTLWKLVSAGEIEYRKIGRAIRLNRESLELYMHGDADDSGESARAQYPSRASDEVRGRSEVS